MHTMKTFQQWWDSLSLDKRPFGTAYERFLKAAIAAPAASALPSWSPLMAEPYCVMIEATPFALLMSWTGSAAMSRMTLGLVIGADLFAL